MPFTPETIHELEQRLLPGETAEPVADISGVRRDLSSHVMEVLGARNDVSVIEAIGSTADDTENRYSDKDLGIVVAGDQAMNRILTDAPEIYASLGDLVGWYAYNPYHHYVVYDAPEGPIPLDMYYLSSRLHQLLTGAETTVLMDTTGKGVPEDRKPHIVSALLLDGHAGLLEAEQAWRQGAWETAVGLLDSVREQQLIHLLRLVEGYAIPHIKAVQLDRFPSEFVRNRFIESYAQPTADSIAAALQAQFTLFGMLQARGEPYSTVTTDLISAVMTLRGNPESGGIDRYIPRLRAAAETERREAETNLSELPEQLVYARGLELLPSSVVQDRTLTHLLQGGEREFVLLYRDDAALIRGLASLPGHFPESRLVFHSPVHVEISGQPGTPPIEVYCISNAVYYTTRKVTNKTLLRRHQSNPGAASPAEWHPSEPAEPIASDPEQIFLKGSVRTFRLLSKINKSDYVTAAYILNDIRRGQLEPLLRSALPEAAAVAQELSQLYTATFPRPTGSEVTAAVKAMTVLFSWLYERQRRHIGTRLDDYMHKIHTVVTHYSL